MGFVQIIQYRTSKIDEMNAVGKEWEAAAADVRTTERVITCADRDHDGQYFTLAFFDSYEAAMANSDLPVTQEFSQRMMALADGAPTFYNLDVIEDMA